MFAATGDVRFKQRADYIVGELKIVQDKQGDGFAGALQGVREAFAEVSKGHIRSANFDLNGLWSPWYTLHKTFAGLRDAYRHTGNHTALDVEVKFAGWVEGVLAPMDDGMIQRMLATEFGGMNEVLADLYADTGDTRWLALSYKFEHKAVFDPLRRHQDPLNGLHANTQVPKAIGLASRYVSAGRDEDYTAATFFWDTVVNHHTFATGGHGKDEYFRDPDRLANITGGRTAETCNVYNMLKLTRTLFALKPDIRYAEFHERALFNHILGSMDVEDGATCYMVPVGAGVRREYADMQRSFTCCVGTGMESHALHGLGIYYESGDRLWVNVYAPSTAEWKAAGVRVTMDTEFPAGPATTLTVDARAPHTFTLALRRPSWAERGFGVSVNGEAVANLPPPGAYVEIPRQWKTGDTVRIAAPMTLRLERLADNSKRAAVMLGPLVLAGDLGPAPKRGDDGDGDGPRTVAGDAPVLVTDRPVDQWLTPIEGRPNSFRTKGIARRVSNQESVDVEFQPFYQIHRRTYAAYWDVLTDAELKSRSEAYAAEQKRQLNLTQASVGALTTIDAGAESKFAQQGEETTIVRAEGRPGRRSAQWFSYSLAVDPAETTSLVVTYNTDNRQPRSFDIVVDGRRVADQAFPRSSVSKFVDLEYRLPDDLVRGKTAITVRFDATGGLEVAPVFAVRTVRTARLVRAD
jgi:hypothetical protein